MSSTKSTRKAAWPPVHSTPYSKTEETEVQVVTRLLEQLCPVFSQDAKIVLDEGVCLC